MLVGAQSGNALRLGDPVVVQVERVDAPRGRVDLSPVEMSWRQRHRAGEAIEAPIVQQPRPATGGVRRRVRGPGGHALSPGSGPATGVAHAGRPAQGVGEHRGWRGGRAPARGRRRAAHEACSSPAPGGMPVATVAVRPAVTGFGGAEVLASAWPNAGTPGVTQRESSSSLTAPSSARAQVHADQLERGVGGHRGGLDRVVDRVLDRVGAGARGRAARTAARARPRRRARRRAGGGAPRPGRARRGRPARRPRTSCGTTTKVREPGKCPRSPSTAPMTSSPRGSGTWCAPSARRRGPRPA